MVPSCSSLVLSSLIAQTINSACPPFCRRFPLHSPKVSCSGLHQNWAFTGIVWQLTRACSATQQFDSFFGFVLSTLSRSTQPVCSRRKKTHFTSLSPLRVASLDQQRLFLLFGFDTIWQYRVIHILNK